MREKYQCPECSKKAMIKLQLLERWWCKSCDAEIDVDQTIKQWALNGYNRKDNYDVKT
jgi:ribosomal protein L37AE/L43A